MDNEDLNRSRDLFWNRNKPKALLKAREYEHPGKAAFAVIGEAFHTRREPEEIEFKSHLGHTVSTNITLSSDYEDEVIKEFLSIIEELTEANIEGTKIVEESDDFLGTNKQFRVDISYEEDNSSFFCSVQ